MRGAVAPRTASIELAEMQSRPERTGAVGKFFVTPHAVTRYIERVRPGIERAQALRELIYIGELAHKVGPYRGLRGLGVELEFWRGPRFGNLRQSKLRFVVAPGSGSELPQIVTVL